MNNESKCFGEESKRVETEEGKEEDTTSLMVKEFRRMGIRNRALGVLHVKIGFLLVLVWLLACVSISVTYKRQIT
jgi:hypothetical protein